MPVILRLMFEVIYPQFLCALSVTFFYILFLDIAERKKKFTPVYLAMSIPTYAFLFAFHGYYVAVWLIACFMVHRKEWWLG